MTKFIALIWDASDDGASEQASTLARIILTAAPDRRHLLLECSGLRVFGQAASSSSAESCRLDQNTGIVIGTIFEKTSDHQGVPSRRFSFSESESRALVASKGRALLERCWGRYVAFIHNAQTQTTWVLRDPTGAVDCMRVEFGNVYVLFSSMKEFPHPSSQNWSINWDYVAAKVCCQLPDTRETGLNEVTRILPGECAEFHNQNLSIVAYWHPRQFVGSGPHQRLNNAEKELRSTVVTSVHAWASCFPKIVHLLSGGLDSAIVLSALATAPHKPRVTCINQYYSPSPVNDERMFARIMAARTAHELLEYEPSARVDLSTLTGISACPSPTNFIQPLLLSMPLRDMARERGARAMFSGNGGDEVFFRGAPRYACADQVFGHGPGRAAFRFAMYEGVRFGISFSRALLRGLRTGLFPGAPSALVLKRAGRISPMISRETAEAVLNQALFVPVWLRGDDRLPPGKVWQILLLASVLSDSRLQQVIEDDMDEIDPLLSQPIIELGLRTPTSAQAEGGWDRAIARRAFSRDIPREIAWRPDKGVVDEFLKHFVAINLPNLRQLLLDGLLLKERIVDRRHLQLALDPSRSKGFGFPVEVCQLAATEIWLTSWKRPARVNAAA